MPSYRLTLPALALWLPFAGAAAGQEPARPPLLDQVVLCRDISEAAQRLACYDGAVEALDAAERQGELVVVDRQQVQASRRALFGFEMPALPAFGRVSVPDDEINDVETTLERASRGSDNKWLFRLADGSVWRQIDSSASGYFRTEAGDAVRVRRASLGSYMLTVGNSRAIRVRREQ